ncbi:hypothetical protein AAD018_007095 [Aestuariibius insulae]|uniref:hypothetical protein n=1 Tax=Aestuariibius insulae TaxID=2058287 RepID=UPI00345EA7A3
MTPQTRTPGAFPALAGSTLMLMIIAGSVATVAFDIWGQVIAPWIGLGNLSPDGLARSLLGTFGLPNGRPEGIFMHLVIVGLIGYPVGYLFIFRPIWERVTGQTGWFLASAVYGFGLWVFAIGGITAIADGVPFFLNFTRIAWVALAGHVLYGIVAGWIIAYLEAPRA